MVIAAVGTVLAAGYLLWLLQRVAFGQPKAEWAGHHFDDVLTTEWIAWAPFLIGIVVLGVYPHFLFHITDGAVSGMLKTALGG